MKATIALCFLVLLAIADTEYNGESDKLEELDIKNAIVELQKKIRSQMADNVEALIWTRAFLATKQKIAYYGFESNLSEVLHKIRIAVNSMRDEGHEAEYCYDEALDELKRLQKDAKMKFADCVNSCIQNFTVSLNATETFLNEGRAIITIINDVYDICTILPAVNQTNCIFIHINKNRFRVAIFNKEYKLQPAYRTMLINDTITDMFQCLRLRNDDGMAKLAEIESVNKLCLRGAKQLSVIEKDVDPTFT
ncbi:hypothetical protein KM043_018577 [Ampulex compressa]|uniref:Venom protein n=1 Tax=Ampulex compressa TaxID=860918 RepID=A0A1W6EVV5_AMPCP|nr:venom protein [Ampulex compressa]KAG7202242.1 hypothetical protein KM043_018577 [Ampulex compressa]